MPTDRSGEEGPQPVMSPESVDAAAGSARARVTYANLDPDDPGHPLTEGGFWGDFMRSLSGRWKAFNADADPTTGTFEDDEADGQTQLVTDGGREQPRDGDTHAFLGDCLECGERMVEVLRTNGGDTRTVQLECEGACDNVSRLRHDFDENPFDDPIVREGVENVRSGMVSWHDCPRCHGHGWVEDPIDDLRRAMSGREHACPRCDTTGSILGEVKELAE